MFLFGMPRNCMKAPKAAVPWCALKYGFQGSILTFLTLQYGTEKQTFLPQNTQRLIVQIFGTTTAMYHCLRMCKITRIICASVICDFIIFAHLGLVGKVLRKIYSRNMCSRRLAHMMTKQNGLVATGRSGSLLSSRDEWDIYCGSTISARPRSRITTVHQ